MKSLILAGGRGKRLNELSENKNKCMFKIKDKSQTILSDKYVLEYSMDYAIDANVDEIVMVVGHQAEEIINHFGNSYKNKRIKYAIQGEQKGLVHAIECARESIDGDDFLLLLGDEIMLNPKHNAMVEEFNKSSVFGICGVLKVDNRELIKKTYTLVADNGDIIYRLIEKPRNPLNNLMGTGNCVFKNGIFNYIQYTPVHHERNEKELPDLIQCAIDDGKTVKSFIICDKYININSYDDLACAEKFLKFQ